MLICLNMVHNFVYSTECERMQKGKWRYFEHKEIILLFQRFYYAFCSNTCLVYQRFATDAIERKVCIILTEAILLYGVGSYLGSKKGAHFSLTGAVCVSSHRHRYFQCIWLRLKRNSCNWLFVMSTRVNLCAFQN